MARSRIAARPVGLPTARRHRDRLDDPDGPNGVRNIEGRLVRENADGVVPYDRILRERNPDIERAHLCFSYGRVLCFVPPNTGT